MKTLIDVNKVKEMAASGHNIVEIGRAFGMSKRTFLRRKDSNPEMKKLYEIGLREYTEKSTGRQIKKTGGNWATEGFISPTISISDYDELVLQYLSGNPSDSRFHAIRKALQISQDELSAIMVTLILDTKQVKVRRDRRGDAWYHLTNNQGAHEGLNWNRPIGHAAGTELALGR
jgi:hypothetical protein